MALTIMTFMRLAKWDDVYENNRTRDLKRMEWVPVPNRMDGDGYTELVDHPNGAAHLGAWIAIIQIASKCDERGTLMRDGAAPHTSASLSRISRLPQVIFDEVLPRLQKIGWIEVICTDTQQDTDIPHVSAGIPHVAATECLWNGMERNGMERKNTLPPNGAPKPPHPFVSLRQQQCFEEFWKVYWRKVDKAAAAKSYSKKIRTENLHGAVMLAVKTQTPIMLGRDPENRPHGSTWLNNERWEDQPTAVPKFSSPDPSPHETPEQMRAREAKSAEVDEAARATRLAERRARKEGAAT